VRASRISIVAAVVALGGPACGGPAPLGRSPTPSGASPTPSGPRILPWQLETDGAPPFVVGSYDAREKVHCRFVHDEKGVLRCLPPVPAALSESTAFTDATCQTRIYAAAPADVPGLVARPVTVPLLRNACEPKRHAVATLAPLPAGSGHFGGTPCAPVDIPLDTRGKVELVIERAEPSDGWATGTEVDGPLLSNGVRVRQVESAEGARFDDHLVIEALGKPCRIDFDANGAYFCMPTLPDFAAHEGTDCMGPLAWRAPACSPPAFIVRSEGTFEVGAQWTGPISNPGHGCGPVVWPDTTDGPYAYYEQGAPVDPFVPPAVSFDRAGTGRLLLHGVRRDDDGAVLDDEITPPYWVRAPRYFDTGANRECDPVWTPDGRVRCIPTTIVDQADAPPYTLVYADRKCTQPAGTCPTGESCDGAIIVSATGFASGQLHGVALHRAAGLSAGYFLGTNGCQFVTSEGQQSFYYTVGSEEPWDAYPELVERNGTVAP
jgi:hypothetical protein